MKNINTYVDKRFTHWALECEIWCI